MSIHTNIDIPITHPTTDEPVDAIVSFYYCKGYAGSYDEEPYSPELELSSCVVDGIDILDIMDAWQVNNIEETLMESMFNDEDFDRPEYEYPEEYEG